MDPSARGGLGDLAPALEELPLFPLPTVLLPGALMPLHVFEPRYRAMLRDVLAGHRVLSVVLVLEGSGPSGLPPLAAVAGVGDVVDYAELAGGRYDILVRGRARVRLDERPFVPPYRRARAAVLASSGEASAADVAALASAATAFATVVRQRDPAFELGLPREARPGELADLCASRLLLDVRDRQAVLEELDVGARVRRVAEALTLQRALLAPDRRDVN
jgi:ATP-dependent Lon protease